MTNYSRYIYKIIQFIKDNGCKFTINTKLPEKIAGRCDYQNRLIEINQPSAKEALLTCLHEAGHWLSYIRLKNNGIDYNKQEREILACLYGWLVAIKTGTDQVISRKKWKEWNL